MSFNSIEDIYKVYGWTVGSRIDYLIQRKSNGESKEEIYEDVVQKKKLMKSKSFQNYWNRLNKIEEDILYVG
tara:strand:- start:2968 stop:3183 length:216 start_codon:yes stop_codon:yes gene_type:complete